MPFSNTDNHATDYISEKKNQKNRQTVVNIPNFLNLSFGKLKYHTIKPYGSLFYPGLGIHNLEFFRNSSRILKKKSDRKSWKVTKGIGIFQFISSEFLSKK